MQTKPEVTTWHAHSANGNHIAATYTMVRFPDGREVRFMEKLSKREAIRQAESIRLSEQRVGGTWGTFADAD